MGNKGTLLKRLAEADSEKAVYSVPYLQSGYGGSIEVPERLQEGWSSMIFLRGS